MGETETKLSTLIDLLRLRSLNEPTLAAYRFLVDGEGETSQLTYGELDLRARSLAALLQSRSLQGERVLLLYPSGLDFIVAFFACLYAGAVAIPAGMSQTKRGLSRLQAIADDAQAACALTTRQVLSRIELLQGEPAAWACHVDWLATDTLADDDAAQWREPSTNGDALAYLQYTSGSTSTPKGAMVTHANILENSAYIRHGFEHGPQSVSLSWLPHFHDMGLVDGIIQPLYSGCPGLLMSPAALLQRPVRWLQAISRYRVTHSGGPNFAYDLCVRRIDEAQLASLDLSTWSVAYNGAEPVHHETLERFALAFASCGFRRQAFYPAYGLAEATLKVSGGRRNDGPVYCTVHGAELEHHRVVQADAGAVDARTLVGSGRPELGTDVVIVNPEAARVCAPDEVGEVWVSGPGVAAGYWNRPEETERTFHARLSKNGKGPYLRTGDLGFVLEGELFITGRLKDLIIIRGRNHYPQDIERAVQQCHVALKPECGAAFSIQLESEERLVVVQEIETRRQNEAPAIIETIREVIAEEFEIQPAAVVLLRSGTLPKTSSGKTRRTACREGFLGNSLSVITEWRAPKPADQKRLVPDAPGELSAETVERWLRLLLTARLNIEAPIDVNQPIARYGIDSLLALELTHAVETGLGVKLPLTSFLRNPTIADLTNETLFEMAQSKRSLAVAGVPTVDQVGEHPLSHGQQALWALQQVSPQSTAYNISVAARIGGELDTRAMEHAFRALIQSHPMLRATFPSRQGAPMCLIPERAEISFHIEDAIGWSEEGLRSRLHAEAATSFDLERGPLLRVSLFERSAQEYVLLLSAHHIIVDFWSLEILIRELGQLYEAEIGGTPAPLVHRLSPYADYVRRQAELLSGAEGERLRKYWLRKLAGDLPQLDLPTNRTRPSMQTYRGASVSATLDQRLTSRLKEFSTGQEATLFMTLLAAFQALLYRSTGQEDILVGSPSSGRGSAEFAGTVGYFVNPLVLRAKVSGDKSFSEFLAETRRTALEALEHQDYPFDLLVKELQPERDPARSPVFQVMFAFQKTQLPEHQELAAFALGEDGVKLKLGGLPMESMALEQRTAQFDLSLTVAEVDSALVTSFEYNTDLFDSSSVERLNEHFRILLESIVADPSVNLSELPLLSDAERRQLLYDWNDTRAEFTSLACVHECFEQQAKRTPDWIAISSEHETLSYRELNERANRLAHYLRARGVGPDVPVGVCVPRSAAMLVCVLGILKAGGTYIPLDPSYPEERLVFMIEDSGAALLLTNQEFAAGRLVSCGVRPVLLDVEGPAIEDESDADPLPSATAGSLAYIIYTSGSTGAPKGVMVEHGSLMNYIRAANVAYDIVPEDRVLQFSSFSFDASVEEIFVCLTSGATLVLRDGDVPQDPVAFLNECREKKLTVLDLPTAYWHQLVSHLTWRDWDTVIHLRLVIIGGDEPLRERVERWRREVGPRVRLVNTYGPTEATIVSTMCDLTDDAEGQHTSTAIPIGRPVANTQAYVLDHQLQPVIVGARGELYLGGAGLSRGYLGHPELTAEQFIPHPFSSAPGARLYRTGDLARYLPDGQIEFQGRVDEQVKIRGHRIEPAEIEATLLRHEAVREAVVIAREETEGERCLAAYVVADTVNGHKTKTTPTTLRNFLADCVPKHMIPSSFTLMEALPRLPSGKVNRRALPAPDSERSGASGFYFAPRTPSERVLCDIWAEVLKLERVAVDDNFFELGGDSILSIQVAARARLAGLQLSPSQIFQHPTPAELACVATVAHASRVSIEPHAEQVSGEVPLTPIQRWFFEQNFSSPDHWNMALMLKTRERLEPHLLERAFVYLLKHHDALRLRFSNELEEWRQSIAEPDRPGAGSNREHVRVVDLSNLAESEQQPALERIADETQTQLNLANGLLLRAVLFELGAGRPQRVFIVIHHLVVDGVSWRILLEDLGHVYRQLQRGESVSLPLKTSSFARWAKLLEEYALSEQARSELKHWTALSAKRVKRLPLDLRKGPNTEAETRTLTIALDTDETQALLREVAQAYHTRINVVLLTALLEAISHWTREPSILVEIEGHGREDLFEDLDLSRTVGWFTNAFPVLLETKEGLTPAAALQSVKEQLGAIPKHGIGYGLLRYLSGDVEIARQMRRMPEPEVSFNYLGQLDQMLEDSALFEQTRESCGRSRHDGARRSQLLEVNAYVINQQLKIDWVYGAGFHLHSTIEGLAQRFVETLRTIITHCHERTAGNLTPSEDIYPLASAQQGMLFHSLYVPGSAMYTGQLGFILRGDLDAEAFTRAWSRVIERHAILRSSFIWENLVEPLQVVNQRVQAPLEWHDWREHSAAEQEQRLKALLEEERRRGFDLSVAPLMRLKLVQLSAESYRFIWTHHHLVLDGWSLAILLGEVFAAYEALSQGLDERPPRNREYREYIEWLRQQDASRATSFWRTYLHGFVAPTPLAVDHAPADPAREPDTLRLRARLSKEVTDRLRVFARQHQLTLNTLVQGAWALLLGRYSRETDLLYGATVSGRPASFAGIDRMVGVFINTLPVRVCVLPEMSVTAWLKRIQDEQVMCREYEHSSLVELQGLSAAPRGAPLFESLLVFENYPLDVRALGSGEGLKATDVWWFDQTNYPLTIVVTPQAELSLEIFYNAHRFTGDVVQRMLGHLQTILDGFSADPSRVLARIPLVTADEQSVLLSQWNDTRKAGPWLGCCVHQLFAEQARRSPDRIALVCGTEQLTYGELNARANRLAHYLVALGVERESRVCICLEPGVEMIVAVFAALKAGAAYVPLDPAYPDSRLAFMLDDCGAQVLLTETRLLDGRLRPGGVRTVCLDAERVEISREPADDPAVKVSSDNLIYVIYTSGSTGRPKGAGVTHGGFVNLVNWFVSEFGLTAHERVLIISSFSFDLTQKDIFAPLTVGGRLQFPTSALYDATEIVETISEHEITLINCTPSAFYPLVDNAGPGFQRLASLKHVFLGGEPINVSRLREWTSTPHFNAEIVNTYGPTECADTCSSFRLADFEKATTAPPIGKPNDNAELLILDPYLNFVPQGVAGELCVGGVGVGRGYLNDPALTAERFVPHPFSSVPGARLYRTGDLTRHLPDGVIEFLGRLDHQVKVNGYRIELGEVETMMVQHEAVQECVVIVRADGQGNPRLVAYVVPEQRAQPPEATTLRRYLAESLPSYMVPSVFVSLEQLPLTPGGKVNRRALPAPDITSNGIGADYVAPRTPVEEVLAGIWRDVLEVERVGIHHNFFDLGGHSMLAMRCVSAMRRLFRVEIPLRVLFESASLAELAHDLKAYEDQPGKLEKIARVLQKVKSASPEELQNQLQQKRASKRAIKEDA